MDPQHHAPPQIPIADDNETKNFIARFFPHLIESPKVRALSVREALKEQSKIASGEIKAEELMANDILGIMAQGGLTLEIMKLQADAKPWPGQNTDINQQERDRVTRQVEETQRRNENPTPGIRNLVRRQFGLPKNR